MTVPKKYLFPIHLVFIQAIVEGTGIKGTGFIHVGVTVSQVDSCIDGCGQKVTRLCREF